jgi:type I restriction enzyme M protein
LKGGLARTTSKPSIALDDKRAPVDENDLPDCLRRWRARNPSKDVDRTAKAFLVPADEIREANYDLSLSRYQQTVHEEEEYDPPQVILQRMKSLNDDIASDVAELAGMLG